MYVKSVIFASMTHNSFEDILIIEETELKTAKVSSKDTETIP